MENPNDILELFEFVEKNFDVGRFSYRGMNFWPLLRNEVRLNLGFNVFPTTSYQVKLRRKTLSDYIKIPLRSIKLQRLNKRFRNSLKPLNGNHQIFTYPNSMFVDTIHEKKYCRYIDPYYEVLKKDFPDISYYGILNKNERPVDTLHPVSFLSLVEFEEYLELKTFLESYDVARAEELENLKRAFEEANNLIFSRYNIHPLYSGLISNCLYVYNYKSYFDELFQISSTKLVFIEDYHIFLQMSLCASAKGHKIKVIEIQHGVLDCKYFPFLNKKVDYKILPDFFWCWSKYDRDLIKHYNSDFKFLKSFVGGNMWLKKFVENEISITSEEEEIFLESICKKYEKVVLIALQPVFLLMDVMLETIRNAPRSIFFLVRYHPLNTTAIEKSQIKDALSQFDNVELDIASRVNIYSLFKKSHFQLTHSSTTTIEALVFNLPTIICSEIGKDLYRDQINDGVVLFSTDHNGILELIKKGAMANQDNKPKYIINSDEKKALDSLRAVLN